jgi:hypothetical protein
MSLSSVGVHAPPAGSVKWMPLSVRTVWTLYGTALMRAQEVASDLRRGFLMKLDEGEFGRPVDGDEEVELAFGGSHLGDVDVEVADRVGLESGLEGLVALHLR